MIVSIHQPSYWPWLGLLDKIAKSDLYIILDDVAANKAAYQYRNVFYYEGEAKFLTLPVNYELGRLIKDLEFRNNHWRVSHLEKLKNYYRAAEHITGLVDDMEAMYLKNEWAKPVDLMIATMRYPMDFLNIQVDVTKSSDLGVAGKKASKLLNLCRKVNADVYLSGKGARDYMSREDMKAFAAKGIEVRWQNFQHPVYEQLPEYPFIEGLACFDLFAFHGKEGAREIFWRSARND